MATDCEFDKLFTKEIPHIHEKIFLSLDLKSFINCLEVSTSWHSLLASGYFSRKLQSVFSEDIGKEVWQAAKNGNVIVIQRVLSYFSVDLNSMTDQVSYVNGYFSGSPLHYAARNGHTHVVQLFLKKGADSNSVNVYGIPPLKHASYHGTKMW